MYNNVLGRQEVTMFELSGIGYVLGYSLSKQSKTIQDYITINPKLKVTP